MSSRPMSVAQDSVQPVAGEPACDTPTLPNNNLNGQPTSPLDPPSALFSSTNSRGSISSDVNSTNMITPGTPGYSAPSLGSEAGLVTATQAVGADASGYLKEGRGDVNESGVPSDKALGSRKRLLLTIGGVILIVIAVAVGVPVGIISKKNASSASTASGPSSNSSSNDKPKGTIVYGGDGTQVTTETGATFTYNNKFGGYFVQDPSNPFNNNARPNSWTPPLNQTWEWGKDRVNGVNLGGWLVLEPFISPALYQKYPGTIDEWTLSEAMRRDTASGGIEKQLEDHYKTFITEEDFAQIAGAGLNFIRLPIPFWAIETWDSVGEPFLAKVAWKYVLKAFEWARKYGLRLCLDLHAVPGSQNAYNHSGQFGKLNFLNGVMGVANAQRTLDYIRVITEFISQPEYNDLVVMFGILNEPTGMPSEALSAFYLQAHNMIRNITGTGAGNGPYISIHDGFGRIIRDDFLNGADRLALEPHPYFAFNGAGSTDIKPYIPRPCENWSAGFNASRRAFGVLTAGEFSLGFNDCGLFLHTTADEHTTGDCKQWDEWENYTPEMKADLKSFALSSMDATGDWFFWTWKIGPSSVVNSPRSPLWSYKLGLDNGWMPTDPREARGQCASLGVAQNSPFDGNFKPYQIGGAGAGVINQADIQAFGQWPPPAIGGHPDATALPTYTATGPIPTLPTATFAAAPAPTGVDGWFNDADTTPAVAPIAGCNYPPAWDAIGASVPSGCT